MYSFLVSKSFFKSTLKLFALLVLLQNSGCISSKKLVYFQTLQDSSANNVLQSAERYTPKVQVGDVLSIQVNSLNQEASAFFNPYAAISATNNQQVNANTAPIASNYGYLVSPQGTITLPLIGDQPVKDKTTGQIADMIREKLKSYLKEPTVSVRNLNFRISVLGEVQRPSLFTIPNEQITLPEALALAGDLTVYGQRNNILVIREEGGQKTFARLDLTKRDLFSSPYYYLHPNDIVYIEPGSARAASVDRFNQITPLVLSALSFVAIIFSNALR
ncbi:polysaccharide biosynthesis/export family protein [Spirosoma pomorum]